MVFWCGLKSAAKYVVQGQGQLPLMPALELSGGSYKVICS